MKLIVQIPCFNEEKTIATTIADIPRFIPGVDSVEILIIDDGCVDRTVDFARKAGADHIVSHGKNRGLAHSFRTGIDTALHLGADIIVNTDGDNQYCGYDIPVLIEPILSKTADCVIGDRSPGNNPHFPPVKRRLQILGSFVVRTLTGQKINDAVSGFRAYSREVALELIVQSQFSYTIETLIQMSKSSYAITSVPIHTNPKTRESRLFRSIPEFLRKSATILIHVYLTYSPLPIFVFLSFLFGMIGVIPIIRFLVLFFTGQGQGHIQSVVLGGVCLVIALILLVMGLLAELISWNRKLLEKNLLLTKKLEFDFSSWKNSTIFVGSHEVMKNPHIHLPKNTQDKVDSISNAG